MVVRLNDLKKDEKKSGLVRLSDLQAENQRQTGERYSERLRSAPEIYNPMVVQQNIADRFSPAKAEAARVSAAEQRQDDARNSPLGRLFQAGMDLNKKAAGMINQQVPGMKESEINQNLGKDVLGVLDSLSNAEQARANTPVGAFLGGMDDAATLGLRSFTERMMGNPEVADRFTESGPGKAGQIAGQVILPAGKLKAGASILSNAGRGALAGLGLGAGIEAGEYLTGRNDQSLGERALDVGESGALGGIGAGVFDLLGKGVGALARRMRSNNVPEETVQELLALPAPRERGKANTAATDDVITTADTRMPTLALPAPDMLPPTTARIDRQANPYRQQFESLVTQARQLQDEGRLTPGREMEDLESLWSQMAGRDGVGLDELIQRAYPSQQSRVTPDLVQRARSTQYAREVAGAPLPVRSTSDRLTRPQGVLADVEAPSVRVGRGQLQAAGERLQRVRRDSVAGPVSPQAQVSATASPVTKSNQTAPRFERGFNRTLRESDNVTADVRTGLEQTQNRSYEAITNEQTLKAANRRIERKGIDQAEAQLLGKKKFTAEDVATGMRLIQQLQDSADVERAVTIADKLATELTRAGQTVQAASIWNRLSPEGALLAATQKVNRVNENLLRGQTPVKITEQQATTITEAAQTMQSAGMSQERAGTVSEIMDRVRKGEDITPEERKLVADFVQDAKRFLQPEKVKPPKQAAVPKEMKDTRVRDRVVSYLEEQEKAALERIRARRGRMNSLPLDEWADYAVVGATKLAKNTIKFADWSEQMVRDLGEEVRPYLNAIYQKSQELRDSSVKKINEQVISNAERIATSYVKRNEANLSPEDIDFVQNLARKVSDLSGAERRVASQDLQAVLSGFEKAGIGRKIQSAQYISMLLNPLTQVRNVVGNELLYRFERLQRVIATPIDIAASKITGGPRTVTFKRGPHVWDNFFQPAQDFFGSLGEGMRAGWRGVSPEGLTTKYEIQGQAFRSKYNPLTYMEKTLGAVMQGFDYAAYTRAVNQRMSEMAYLNALNNGVKGDEAIRRHMNTFMTNIDDTVHNIAKDYGKYITLQNDSALARAMLGFRRTANKLTTTSPDFGVGSTVMPFAKTPANLLLRGLDYSPAGALKGLWQMSKVLRDPNTDLTRADVIESVSRALFGTGIGILAFWLTDMGALFGKSEKDSEVRKLMQNSGVKDFQVNGSAIMRMISAVMTGKDVRQAAKLQDGDTLWGYEWAQPISIPAAVGSTVYQGSKEGKGGFMAGVDGALAGLTTLYDSSVLSSLNEIFKIPPNESNTVKAIGMNLLEQIPGQFVPSMVRQINTLSDNRMRETYAPKSDVLGQFTNYAESNVPGLAQRMPQRVDTLGQPVTRLNTFLDVFVSPAARSKYKPTPEAQLVIDLINETGDNSVAPRAVAKYLTGKDKTGASVRIDLTPEQFVELQTIVGKETAERLKKVNPNWTTEKKVEFIVKQLTEAGKIGRDKLKRDLGLK